VQQIRGFAQSPEMLSAVLAWVEKQRRESGGLPITDPEDLRHDVQQFEALWEQLTTIEQEKFIRTLVADVRYERPTGIVTSVFTAKESSKLPNRLESCHQPRGGL
jgi:hypothetical protein